VIDEDLLRKYCLLKTAAAYFPLDFGACHLELGTWNLILDIWNLDFEIWCLEFAIFQVT
jgi:hypothetical protein